MPLKAKNYKYDVALSFAGEDRNIAKRLVDRMLSYGIRVFYDRFEQAKLLGVDLYQYLQRIYRDEACFCAILISEAYASKLWPSHELKQAQARAFEESSEYILPIRLDDTEIPGINRTTGYVDLRELSIEDVAKIIFQKLNESRDYRTWYETPTNIDEFSPRLRTALDQVTSLVASEISRIVLQCNNADNTLELTIDNHNKLDSIANATELDIETIIIDDTGIYIHHPWRDLIGQSIQSQWMHFAGFAKWQIETIQQLYRGYLTWKDNYNSDPQLETEFSQRPGYTRRTLVGFRRLQVSEGIYWNIAVESHEVAKLGSQTIR